MSRNRGRTDCRCGLEFPPPGTSPTLTEAEYLLVIGCNPEKYVYRGWTDPVVRFECPDCACLYSLRLKRDDDGGWAVADSSFWYAYNDEPGDGDAPTWEALYVSRQTTAASAMALRAVTDAMARHIHAYDDVALTSAGRAWFNYLHAEAIAWDAVLMSRNEQRAKHATAR